MALIERKLKDLGLVIPEVAQPLAAYVPWVKTGALVFVSGQLPMRSGQVVYTGRLGQNITVEEGVEAAQLCALNILAHLKQACGGDLERVRRFVKVTGFVNATSEFYHISAVLNGASELFVALFGDAGKHARSTIATGLPLNAAVEVEAIVELRV